MADVAEMTRPRRSKVAGPIGFTVDVTPVAVTGNEIFCQIDPATGTPHKYTQGGLIKLPVAGQAYTITFQLQPGIVPNLQFYTSDPFWSASTCPTVFGNDSQFNPQTPSGTTNLNVDGTPRAPKNVVYYRLNFTDGTTQYYCDPIIVNN